MSSGSVQIRAGVLFSDQTLDSGGPLGVVTPLNCSQKQREGEQVAHRMRFETLGSVPGIFAHSTLLRKGFAHASPTKTMFNRAALVRLGGRAR
jgi:hypothetical protein